MSSLTREQAIAQDFYQRLRMDMRQWLGGKVGRAHKLADVLCYAPDLVHLLCKLSLDPRVPVHHKARLAAVLAYFVAPVDTLPEAVLGPSGYAEDVALAAHTLTGLFGARREVLVEHWAGDKDVMSALDSALGIVEGLSARGIWQSVLGRFGLN